MAAGLQMIAAFGDELNLDAFESGCSWGRFESEKSGRWQLDKIRSQELKATCVGSG